MHDVDVTTRHVDDYAAIVGTEKVAELRRIAAPLAGLRFRHVNATSYGGGVAEILNNLVPLLTDCGIDCTWSVLDAPVPFFDVTKRVHNALQGMPLDLDDEQRHLFVEVQRENVDTLAASDVVLAHDPQAVAFRTLAPERARGWAWRCHIDLTAAYPPVWSYLRPFVDVYDEAVFTMRQYAQPDLAGPALLFIAPTIDPLAPKNAPLDIKEAREIVTRFGLDPARPLLVQVSRFDPWKDPTGVIDAFRLVRREIPAAQLALVGSLAHDDPEGLGLLAATKQHAGEDRDIVVVTNLDGVRDREVNAFQRCATVVVQKSLREGFGLVVSEALWKGVPVVGGAVGGIPLQVIDGETGYLVRDVAECAARCVTLLRDAALRERMGRAGHEHVLRNFLITRDVRDHLLLAARLAGERR